MIEARVSCLYVGAFFVEPRHLQEIDRIFDKYSKEGARRTVAVALENARSFKATSFSELASLENHPVLDRLAIVALDGESRAGFGPLSITLSSSGISALGIFSEEDATYFEVSISSIVKSARAPYHLMYAPIWKHVFDFIPQLFLLVLLLVVVIPRYKIPDGTWYIILYAGALSIISQAFMAIVRGRLPQLAVLVGEGARLRDRRLAVWRYLLPRAFWQVILWAFSIIVIYILARR